VRASRLEKLLNAEGSATPGSRIVRAMSERGTLSAVEIARHTGLARSTVSTALAALRRSGIVVETGAADSAARGVGRPATALTLNPDGGTCAGIHLGLDGIRVVLADVSHSILSEESVRLGRDYLPARAVAAAKKAVARAFRHNGLSETALLGVGVSVSGPVSPAGQVQRGGILPAWAGKNIRDLFGPAFGRAIFASCSRSTSASAAPS
jgi:DNA-binding transcriptional ArsR family regulator